MCFRRRKRNKKAKQEVVQEQPSKEVVEEVKEEPVTEESSSALESKTKPTPTKDEPNLKTVPLMEKVERTQKYHVSQNNDESSEYFKQWRVRKSGSSKTIKYFRTQKEAIDYAKELAKKYNSDIVIHRMDGRIRKQNY